MITTDSLRFAEQTKCQVFLLKVIPKEFVEEQRSQSIFTFNRNI